MILENEKIEGKALLNVEEVQEYLGIGETMARKLLKNSRNGFGIRIGNRLYANKKKLDQWLDRKCGK